MLVTGLKLNLEEILLLVDDLTLQEKAQLLKRFEDSAKIVHNPLHVLVLGTERILSPSFSSRMLYGT